VNEGSDKKESRIRMGLAPNEFHVHEGEQVARMRSVLG